MRRSWGGISSATNNRRKRPACRLDPTCCQNVSTPVSSAGSQPVRLAMAWLGFRPAFSQVVSNLVRSLSTGQ